MSRKCMIVNLERSFSHVACDKGFLGSLRSMLTHILRAMQLFEVPTTCCGQHNCGDQMQPASEQRSQVAVQFQNQHETMKWKSDQTESGYFIQHNTECREACKVSCLKRCGLGHQRHKSSKKSPQLDLNIPNSNCGRSDCRSFWCVFALSRGFLHPERSEKNTSESGIAVYVSFLIHIL
ncbi:hypothetical protein I3842_11G201300 [Carya illinoinensis]|uniref:Uncharacterized protein n=2 Tax=Carya illinoinensis TaxID=32201 RepID=A0A922DSL1_CARIL|nr:hypothetical protein I3842_11G201300 [Carya illinoinensis]KAG6689990.1 hypothetical protein I3842_11G201300 [Carya illinoinensis]